MQLSSLLFTAALAAQAHARFSGSFRVSYIPSENVCQTYWTAYDDHLADFRVQKSYDCRLNDGNEIATSDSFALWEGGSGRISLYPHDTLRFCRDNKWCTCMTTRFKEILNGPDAPKLFYADFDFDDDKAWPCALPPH